MRRSRCVGFCLLGLVIASLSTGSAGLAAERSFPYEQELLLDARPMKGSKKVPMMEITRNGETEIELWCNTVKAQLVVVEDTVTILTGTKTAQQCAPERMRGDDELLAALEQVTNWRREGDVLTLQGSTSLRFRTSTH